MEQKVEKNIFVNSSSLKVSYKKASYKYISEIKKFKPGQTLIFNISNKCMVKETFPLKLDPSKWIEYCRGNPNDDNVIKNFADIIFFEMI